jgi:hypothetical protein
LEVFPDIFRAEMGGGTLNEDKASSFRRHYGQGFHTSLSAELAHFGFDVQAAENPRPM